MTDHECPVCGMQSDDVRELIAHCRDRHLRLYCIRGTDLAAYANVAFDAPATIVYAGVESALAVKP